MSIHERARSRGDGKGFRNTREANESKSPERRAQSRGKGSVGIEGEEDKDDGVGFDVKEDELNREESNVETYFEYFNKESFCKN